MVDFNKLIEAHLFRELRRKEIGKYYPSEIGNCLRKVFYSYRFPQPVDPQLVKILEVGNLLHHFMAEVLRSEKQKDVKLLESELPIKIETADFKVSGRIDDLLLIMESGKKLLVEIKSTANLKFVNGPSPQHVMQLQLYMQATGVHNGALVYIEKATLQSKSFEVPYDEIAAAEALRRFEILHKHLKEGKTPPPEARLKWEDMGWMCKRCDFRERCWKETPDSDLPNEEKKMMEERI